MSKLVLGNRLRDKISGFSGIAVSRTEYLDGSWSYGLQGPSKDGEKPVLEYINEPQLEFVDSGVELASEG